jgi:AraC-like DNA-binding protein
VFVTGIDGRFDLRLPNGEWVSCRAAIIPAGVRHALDVKGRPLAVFYPEPHIGNFTHLIRLGFGWQVREKILFSDKAEINAFRDLYDRRSDFDFANDGIADLLGFAGASDQHSPVDPRILRVIQQLDAHPADLTSVMKLAAAEGLSGSRFQHLFSEQIGVPFRRFRIWNRLRAALRGALNGQSLTEAAHSAGFSDLAHFARLHQDTFGVTATSTLRRVTRGITNTEPSGLIDPLAASANADLRPPFLSSGVADLEANCLNHLRPAGLPIR